MKSRDAVVLSADVCGYSLLVNDYEAETLHRLVDYQKTFRKYVDRAGGRIFNYAGDAVLAEFPEIDTALIAAVKIQQEIEKRNRLCPLERRMKFRMGITAGRVFERGADLLGDTVNIAARLQTVATPGGICVSETIYLGMDPDLKLLSNDVGLQSVKNIPAPVQTYALSFDQKTLPRRLAFPTMLGLIHYRRKTVISSGVAVALAILAIVAGRQSSVSLTAMTAAIVSPLYHATLTARETTDAHPKVDNPPLRVVVKETNDARGGSMDQGLQPGAVTPAVFHSPSIPINRCKLVIAQQTVVDASECTYTSTAQYLSFAAPSTNGKFNYLARVNLNPDRTGDGFLSGGTTSQERSLGTMIRSGACWISKDESVQLCAWK